MFTLIFTLSIVWFIRIVANVVSFAHLWLVKEYRWDRMLIHLKTPQGRLVYFLPWKRPRVSPKSVLLTGTTLAVLSWFIFFAGLPLLLTLCIADVASFPLMFFLVGLLNIPTQLYHGWVIRRAEERLRMHPHLTVIGITGSYGKTSIKEYLAAILTVKYKTLKTEASKNAPIGIAEVVVSKLTDDHQVFVVEMGAYKKGEISYMARLVRPEIAIITAINAQHQDLFGSLENTMKAKYELVAGLTGKRIAILNADDARVREMGEWARNTGITVWWYGRHGPTPKGDKIFAASDIGEDTNGIHFSCTVGRQTVPVWSHVRGIHQVSNVLAAIAGSVSAGLSLQDAASAARRIESAKHVLEFLRADNGVTFIDDTFNNNPDAAIAALDVLSAQKGKKFLVFQPMIELGRYAASNHREVGAYAAGICDAIILTNLNWSRDFIAGVRSVSKTIPVSVLTGDKAVSYIRKTAEAGDTVLCKGKETARVLTLLPQKS